MLGAIAKAAHVLIHAGSMLGLRHGTEEPAYTFEPLADDVEIRRYGARIAAETTVTANEEAARSAGFRRLAGYIFGGNDSETTIAMTAPVAQQASRRSAGQIAMTAPLSREIDDDTTEWVIRFFMPAQWTSGSLPKPNDTRVRLGTVPPETLAVRRFSGSRTHRTIASQTTRLMTTLRDEGFEPAGKTAAWFYDPPWTFPMFRRNEIVVPVEPKP